MSEFIKGDKVCCPKEYYMGVETEIKATGIIFEISFTGCNVGVRLCSFPLARRWYGQEELMLISRKFVYGKRM